MGPGVLLDLPRPSGTNVLVDHLLGLRPGLGGFPLPRQRLDNHCRHLGCVRTVRKTAKPLASQIVGVHNRRAGEWGDSLLSDKTHSIPAGGENSFSRGVDEIMAYYDGDPLRRVVDKDFDADGDQLVEVARRLE
jgi:hypothetical protein